MTYQDLADLYEALALPGAAHFRRSADQEQVDALACLEDECACNCEACEACDDRH